MVLRDLVPAPRPRAGRLRTLANWQERADGGHTQLAGAGAAAAGPVGPAAHSHLSSRMCSPLRPGRDMVPERGMAGCGTSYVMPSPLALGALGRLHCASTARLARLSAPKDRRRGGLRAASRTGNAVSHPILSFSGAYGRSQSARAAERSSVDFDRTRIGAQEPGGVPRTAPGSARTGSHVYPARTNGHNFLMQYRRLEEPQSAGGPAPQPHLPSIGLVPKPPATSSPRRFRPQLGPLPPHSQKQRGTKKRTARSEMDWAATIARGRVEEQKLQPVDGLPDTNQDATTSTPVSANWKQVQLHEQIRVLSKAKDRDEKWNAVLKPWLTKYDKARRWPGSLEERLQNARQEQAELQKREAARMNEISGKAHRRLEEIQFLVARKVTKYHAANKIQKELATMSKFVQEQLRMRVTSRAVLDRIVQIHETMARELFDEMDDDNSGRLDPSEILQLSEQLGHRLSATELRDAMLAMDEDGSDEVDFREFYRWWTRDDKETTFSAARAEEYYTIIPH